MSSVSAASVGTQLATGEIGAADLPDVTCVMVCRPSHKPRLGYREHMTDIGGNAEPGFGAVADAFKANFEEHNEVGAACSVVQDGRLVVDLWGGHRDKKRTKPWVQDTLVTMFSTTKGMASTAVAVAHGRGLFDVDERVSTYWPEFAQNGKQDVTVDQLLRHEAGLAVIDTKLTPEIIDDFDRFGAILAEQKPGWEPGTTHGYHAQSLGWYESQLLSRVDPAGRQIGQFFADEVAAVLDVEFYLGLPPSVGPERLATYLGGSRLGAALHAHELPWAILRRMMNPFGATIKAFMNPKAITKLPDINKRELLELELPSVNGTGTARAVATIYGDMAIGAPRLGIADATLRWLEQDVPPSMDQIFGLESAFLGGFMKQFPLLPFGSSHRAYGHTGSGGSFGYADPDKALGYCYAMNRAGYSLPTDAREIALRTAVDSCIS